jgi:hypothetical protein
VSTCEPWFPRVIGEDQTLHVVVVGPVALLRQLPDLARSGVGDCEGHVVLERACCEARLTFEGVPQGEGPALSPARAEREPARAILVGLSAVAIGELDGRATCQDRDSFGRRVRTGRG